jgi:hypothetical protein
VLLADRLIAFASSDKRLPVRYVSGDTRGEVCRTLSEWSSSRPITVPAGGCITSRSMACAMRVSKTYRATCSRPRDSFQKTFSTAGWHVAHILNAKDRNTDWQVWTRADVQRRFFRNIHPCNCFYVPKRGWHQYGGDPSVVGYLAERYAERYADVWPTFLKLAGAASVPKTDGSTRLVPEHAWKA